MDKTVPVGAAILLDFIRETETGRKDASAYETLYGHNDRKQSRKITTMTVDEWINSGSTWTRNHGSSAAGGYQFMKATLQGLKSELGLRGSQIMDANLQDRLGYHLLKRRSYHAYKDGKITRTEFARKLAQEWASFPVLGETKGAHRTVQRGQSYYSGDKLNKALIKPEEVEKILALVSGVLERQPDDPGIPPSKWAALFEAIWKAIALIFTRSK